MKSIIEKLKRVKKYGVAVFLAAASCFSGFGEGAMDCNTSDPYIGPDGKWYVTVTCIGTQFGTIEVEYDGGGGSCSGCTAMSPEECESVKKSVSDQADSIVDSSLPNISDEWDEIWFQCEEMKNRLEQASNDIDNFKIDLENKQEEYADNSKLDAYYAIGFAMSVLGDYDLPPPTDDLDDMMNSVDDALSSIQFKYEESINSIKYEVLLIKEYVDSMDCSPCSGGGGGGDSGGGDSGDCPCKEVLAAIQDILNNHYNQVKEIKKRLDGWDKNIKQITEGVRTLSYMGTNFTYAVKYRTLDGVSFSMDQIDKILLSKESDKFDFGEFRNLSWYSRIEYLLMSIAGVFSKTNREDTLNSETLDNAYDDVAHRKDTFDATVNNVSSRFDGLHSAIENLMSALSGAVGSGSSSGQITLWASWFGGRGLTMTIPGNVISTSRVVFSLLWTVIFSFTMYQIVVNGWVFIVKFIQFWITQTTGFLK